MILVTGATGNFGRPLVELLPAGGHITSLVALAPPSRRRRDPPRRRGGVIRSGDLEIVLDGHRLQISRERQIVYTLSDMVLKGLVFYTVDGTVALFALALNRPPERILDAADLSMAEWALFAEMIAEVTYARVVMNLPPPFTAS